MSNDNGTSAIQRRGLMLVLSSPSGAGKTTLSRQLLDNDKQIQLSVSCTTRQKRPGERDGVDYRFVDTATFRGMIERKQFLEYAEVFGNYYGTPRGPVDDALNAGKDMLFDIDWQGTQQLRDKGRADLVTVFILPPSTRDLEKRLLTRAQDPKEIVAQRMAKAADEMSHWAEYDYVVVNSDIG
ncbi:MAG TPA: guanylate kinase, partial [Reyranella sp.]